MSVVNLYQIILPVTSLGEAVSFYSQLLGLGGRSVTPERHSFDLGTFSLTCVDTMAEGSTVKAEPPTLYLVTDDLEAALSRARKVHCVAEDRQITSDPWGDRHFLGKDPFGTLIGFVDQETAERQLSEQSVGGPDGFFRTGSALSVQSLKGPDKPKYVASVKKIYKDEIWLQVTDEFRETVEAGESVRIFYWDHEGAFFSDTKASKVSATDPAYLAIAVPFEAKPLQRRGAPRVRARLPLEFSAFKSPESKELRSEVIRAHSEDLSTGGIKFLSDKPPAQGDRLRLKLTLSTTERVVVIANVVSVRPEDNTYAVGAQFLEVPLDDQIKLLQFLIDREEDIKGQDVESAAPPAGPAPEPAPEPEEEKRPEPSPAEPSPASGERQGLEASPAAPVSAGEDFPPFTPDLDLPEFAAPSPEPVEPPDPSVSFVAEPPPSPAPSGLLEVVPVVQEGRVELNLSNWLEEPVQVEHAVALRVGGPMKPLLRTPVEVAAGDSAKLDVTESLLTLFGPGASGLQDPVHILLTLQPEPPEQPAPQSYLFSLAEGRFTEVRHQPQVKA